MYSDIEDGERNRSAFNRIVPVDERVDKDFAHGIRGDEGCFNAAELFRYDPGWKREMALAENLGFFQEFEGGTSDLTLIKKFGLVGSSEASHAQLALWIIGHECFAKEHDRCADWLALVTQVQAIQCIRQILPHGTHKPPHGAGNVHDTEDFLAINVLEGHLLGDLIFPSLPAVHALEKEFLVTALRHLSSGILHPFVWTPFEGVGTEPDAPSARRMRISR